MRHNKKFNHLGRKSAHRKAMLSNMACSLIKHKRITTTTAKAKALQVYIDPILTKSKEDTTHSRRLAFSQLQDKLVVAELFRDIAQKIATRPGGYTRILRTGFRLGDNAEMCIIELVDYNENMLKEKAAKKATRTRRAGGAKKAAAKNDETQVAKEVTEEVAEVKATKTKVAKAKTTEAKAEEVKAVEAEVAETEVVEAVTAEAETTEVETTTEVEAPEAKTTEEEVSEEEKKPTGKAE